MLLAPPMHQPSGWKPAPDRRADIADDGYYPTREWKALRLQCLTRDSSNVPSTIARHQTVAPAAV
jgi:hypothetical protein